MLRWGFNIVAGMSLVFSIVCGTFWYRSIHGGDLFLHASSGRCLILETFPGLITIQRYRAWPTVEPWQWLSASHGPHPSPIISAEFTPLSDGTVGGGWSVTLDDEERLVLAPRLRPVGNPVLRTHESAPIKVHSWFRVRFWTLLAFALPLPLLWLAMCVRRSKTLRRRRRTGLCLNCGYDLRASSERCPECGTPIPASRPAAASL